MRVRTNIIIEDTLLAKIDAIAGEKNKRTAIIDTALREFVAREESKTSAEAATENKSKKAGLNAK